MEPLGSAHSSATTGCLPTRTTPQLAEHARNLYLLSGTPIVNHPSDIAPIIEMLTRQPMSPTQFDSKFVGSKRTWPSLSGFLMGARPTTSPAIRNRDELKQRLQGHVDYHASPDLGVEQIDEHYNTPMSSQQTNLHRAFWNQLPMLLRWKLQQNYPLSKQELANLSSFLSGPRQVSLSTLPFMKGKRDAMLAYQQSPKLQKAMGLLQETLSKDPNSRGVVFSNFLEAGLEPYAAALAAAKIPHAMFHGGLSDAQRKQTVDDYNTGKIRTLLLGPSGSEGISLKGTRLIQLLDPHWNQTRLSQAIGRGIRFDSHTDLPPEQRNVRVQRFASQLPAGVGARMWRWLTQTKPSNDRNNPGTDTYLERMSQRKDDINQQFLDLLKEVGTEKTGAAPIAQLRQAKQHSDAKQYSALQSSDPLHRATTAYADQNAGVKQQPIALLRQAKQHSDARQYSAKVRILRQPHGGVGHGKHLQAIRLLSSGRRRLSNRPLGGEGHEPGRFSRTGRQTEQGAAVSCSVT